MGMRSVYKVLRGRPTPPATPAQEEKVNPIMRSGQRYNFFVPKHDKYQTFVRGRPA